VLCAGVFAGQTWVDKLAGQQLPVTHCGTVWQPKQQAVGIYFGYLFVTKGLAG
jgi:hypothetical protein